MKTLDLNEEWIHKVRFFVRGFIVIEYKNLALCLNTTEKIIPNVFWLTFEESMSVL